MEYLPFGEAGAEPSRAEPAPAPARCEPVPSPAAQGAAPAVRSEAPSRPAALSPGQSQTTAAAAEAFPRFACRVQALAPGYSAVVTLDDAPDLSAAEHRLLGSIAQALGGDATAAHPGEFLRWPLNRNPALDHGAEAMIEWLSHALKLRHPACLVFGEKMAGIVRAAQPALKVIAAPTLAELLVSPAAKAGLWKSLHG